MEAVNSQAILKELAERMQAHSVGVLVLFKEVGITSEEPTLYNLNKARRINREVFEKIIRFLYPEKYDVANAEGEKTKFDWTSLVGGILSGAGAGLMSMKGSGSEMEILQAQTEAQLAQEKAKSNQKMMYIILGVVLVLVVASVIIFKNRK